MKPEQTKTTKSASTFVLNKKKVLADLKSDLAEATKSKLEQDGKRENWLKLYNGDLYGNEEKGRSKIVSRDIKKTEEWLHPTLKDPLVSTSDIVKCSPITEEDRAAAEQSEIILNIQFCNRFDRYNFITQTLKVGGSEGTMIVQTGWEYEDKEIIEEQPIYEIVGFDEAGEPIQEQVGVEEVRRTIITKNQPTAVLCRNQDIYMDPTCKGNMDDCQFIIYRYESNLSNLRKDGRYKNLHKIDVKSETSAPINDTEDYSSEDETEFKFSDDPRKKILVYEYWGFYDVNGDGTTEPIVCVWVNDTIIRFEISPFPDGELPFIVAPFSPVPYSLHGEPLAEILADVQKTETAILRGLIENIAKSTNGQKGFRKGGLDVVNRDRFLRGKNFEYNTSMGDIFQGNFNEIPASAFNMFTLMSNEAESASGVKAFNQGISGVSLGGTATGARGALDASASRRLDLVRNYAENMIKPLLRKWMAYNAEFLDEEQVFRMTNGEFIQVKKDDLEGKIDINLEISTAEDNASKAQELGFLLQTVGPNEDPGIRKLLMAQMLRLYKLPDAAKAIEEYQPQPNPQEEEIHALTKKKLEVEIAERQSRTIENEADTQYKMAKARKLGAEADHDDLDYLNKASGKDVEDKVMVEELKNQHKQEQQLTQAFAKNGNNK